MPALTLVLMPEHRPKGPVSKIHSPDAHFRSTHLQHRGPNSVKRHFVQNRLFIARNAEADAANPNAIAL